MVAKLTIYVLDDMEGESVEDKAYATIALAYEEAGDGSDDPKELDAYVRSIFRIDSVTLHAGTPEQPEEWEVVVSGSDDEIETYEEILEDLE